jgi:mRNA interferase MazF
VSFNPGDIVTVNFPGVTGIKRRPAVVLSSSEYHTIRPDIIIGLITSQTKRLGTTDYILQDWESAGLRVSSVFRSFIVTLITWLWLVMCRNKTGKALQPVLKLPWLQWIINNPLKFEIPTLLYGDVHQAELHWYEAHGVGRRKIKVKRILD